MLPSHQRTIEKWPPFGRVQKIFVCDRQQVNDITPPHPPTMKTAVVVHTLSGVV